MRFGRILVTMLVDQRRWREAEPLALKVLANEDSLQEDSLARVMAGQLAAIYEATGPKEQAEEYEHGCRRHHDGRRDRFGTVRLRPTC